MIGQGVRSLVLRWALATLLSVVVSAMPPANHQLDQDWLVDGSGFEARIERGEETVSLENGLIRRVFRVKDGMATIAYQNLGNGESIIRAVRPEGMLTLNGREMEIGGLIGQPNLAYLTDEWLGAMTADPAAMRLRGIEEGEPVERFKWGNRRYQSRSTAWPPKGVKLSFFFEPSAESPSADVSREVLWSDDFTKMDPAWRRKESDTEERVSFENEGKAGEIYAMGNLHCFAERLIPEGTVMLEAVIHPGSDQSTSWGPGLGLVYGDRVMKVNLRPGDRGEHGHFELRHGGERLARVKDLAAADGGLSLEHAYRLRALLGPVVKWEVSRMPDGAWFPLFEVSSGGGKPESIRVGKMDREGGGSDEVAHPQEWGRCRIESVTAFGKPLESKQSVGSPVRVGVHYELYDGVPVLSKWLTVENRGSETLTVDRFTAESLAMVEHGNSVETRDDVPLPLPRQLHVETDMAFGGFTVDNAKRWTVHMRPDKSYKTQVNYALEQPCLLEVEPTRGPAQDVAPGETFESFRVFELAHDSEDRERRGLALRRMYRTVAPWVTENPLMHHMKTAQPDKVREAIDRAAEVGFEMVILSFGSGFNAENDDPAYLAEWKSVMEHARSKGIDLGCYSLYSSRGIGGGNDIVSPPGERPTHGRCPAITSEWGQGYLKKLYQLFEETGFTVFEHDGAYPGDVDVTARPPLQKGIDDSQWVHWRTWTTFYQWLRERGVYINAPDYYYLSGSNKCGMGYREVNWSLPRAQQLIHTRQNIYDGTWDKTPSMGWMFVPLSQYHGGGAAATIEPLDERIDHYERMILSNLAFGVQACYRGPRLFDTPRVRDMLKSKVDWYKEHRAILESDVIHLRRANGRDLDGMLHVNPELETPAMLAVFNPGETELTETWVVPLYYAGMSGMVRASVDGVAPLELKTDELSRVKIELKVPAGGFQWVLFAR